MLPELFIAFDTETTGLSPVNDRIVEIAAVAFRPDGTQVRSFERLVNPGIPIPPSLVKIHGISDDMVADAPGVDEVLAEFFRFIGTAPLVAHNAPFDASMILMSLGRSARRDGLRLPGNPILDTCTLSRAAFPGAPNYRLGTIARVLGVPPHTAHRALPDVLTCKEIFLKILAKLGPGLSLERLQETNGSTVRLARGEEMLARLPLRLRSPGQVLMLRDAIRDGRPIGIEYAGGTKGTGPRVVTPIFLMQRGAGGCLVAHCHIDSSLKNFWVRKITAVSPAPAS